LLLAVGILDDPPVSGLAGKKFSGGISGGIVIYTGSSSGMERN
jgi:hypothetical protein